ncbi:MAG: type IV pilus modification PilV family protein [Halothiobacillus sp.]
MPARLLTLSQGKFPKRQRGFSLLEILVAFVILAFAMTAIYESAGGSVKATIADERYSYGLLLAQSVLNNYQGVPPGGVEKSGHLENGFDWRITATPRPIDASQPVAWPLYDVQVDVTWGAPQKRVTLVSVLPEFRFKPS